MTTSTLTQNELIDLSLSREELFVVMRLLKAKSLPGFDLSWLKRGPDGAVKDDIRQGLEVATNALIARGYITNVKRSSETAPLTMNMPSPVIAFVGTCAFADYNILLVLHTKQGQSQMYLHQLRELGVAHTMPLPDIHKFEAIDGQPGILRTIDAMLGLDKQTSLALPAGKALVVNVQAARDAALLGATEEARRLLIHGGLPSLTAQAFVHAIQTANIWGMVAIVAHGIDGQVQQAALALVVTPSSCFTLQDDGTVPSSFLIQSIAADTLRTWFAEHISR